MLRQIIHIDEEKCNGCGLCVTACHEGALELVNGKAHLAREHFCDGLGDCLPACPMNAIRFETREAPAYDEAAVQAAKAPAVSKPPAGCPGTHARSFIPRPTVRAESSDTASQLNHWPIQIKLSPVVAPCFDGADLLIAADCTAYACGDFHSRYMAGRVVLVGCPKLDAVDYSEKLAEILRRNAIRSVTLTRMEVPCCGGMERAVRAAIAASGKELSLDVRILRIGSGAEL